ncbi:unnamed protein product [Rhizophagus irregularis]|nr:unnamed protein product [Rhizophagus irregularis]
MSIVCNTCFKGLINQANADTIEDVTPTRILTEFFEDNLVMIICTTPEQLVEWVKCEHFQIELSFKRVVEVNYYNTKHNLILTFAGFLRIVQQLLHINKRIFKALFDLVHQLTGSLVQFKHIHGTGWSCIVADLDYAQAKEKFKKKDSETVKNDMYALLTAESKDKLIKYLIASIAVAEEDTTG